MGASAIDDIRRPAALDGGSDHAAHLVELWTVWNTPGGAVVHEIVGDNDATLSGGDWVEDDDFDDVVDLDEADSLSFGGTPMMSRDAWTVVMWVKWDGPGDGIVDYLPLYNERGGHNATDAFFTLRVKDVNGEIQVIIKNDAGTYVASTAAGALAQGGWAHVAASFDGDDVRVYLDGVLIATEAITGTYTINHRWFGHYHDSATDKWAGAVAEWRVYDVALDAATIAELADDDTGTAWDVYQIGFDAAVYYEDVVLIGLEPSTEGVELTATYYDFWHNADATGLAVSSFVELTAGLIRWSGAIKRNQSATVIFTRDDTGAVVAAHGVGVGDRSEMQLAADGLDDVSVRLASDGLDSVDVATPAGVASTFVEMVVSLWRRQFKKSDITRDTGKLRDFADDGSTVLLEQTVTDDGDQQVRTAATPPA